MDSDALSNGSGHAGDLSTRCIVNFVMDGVWTLDAIIAIKS